MVTELIMMEGGKLEGGPAGFEIATANDVPMAAKSHLIGQAIPWHSDAVCSMSRCSVSRGGAGRLVLHCSDVEAVTGKSAKDQLY